MARKVTELRVGITAHANYHGRLQGRRIVLHGRVYKIREVTLEENTRRGLKAARCHFYITGWESGRKLTTELCQVVFVSNGTGRGWKLYIGGTALKHQRRLFAEWNRKRQPVPSIIHMRIWNMLEAMDKAELSKWLRAAEGIY
jgi:hypothetical protein